MARATQARVFAPVGVAVDRRGILYITNEIGRVRMVGRDGTITTIAGTGRAGPSGDGGPATSARLNVPYGVAVDGSGDVYVTEYAGNRVRKIRRPAAAATPAPASSSSWLYGADAASTLFRIDAASGATRRVGATGVRSMTDIAFTPDGKLYGISFSRLYRVDPRSGRATPIGSGIGMGSVNALASDARGKLYVASTSGAFGTVAPGTGRATLVGSYGPGLGSSGDLVFAPDGKLFATAKLSGRDVLLRVEPDHRRRVGARTARVGRTSTALRSARAGSSSGPRRATHRSPILVSIDPVTGRTRGDRRQLARRPGHVGSSDSDDALLGPHGGCGDERLLQDAVRQHRLLPRSRPAARLSSRAGSTAGSCRRRLAARARTGTTRAIVSRCGRRAGAGALA